MILPENGEKDNKDERPGPMVGIQKDLKYKNLTLLLKEFPKKVWSSEGQKNRKSNKKGKIS